MKNIMSGIAGSAASRNVAPGKAASSRPAGLISRRGRMRAPAVLFAVLFAVLAAAAFAQSTTGGAIGGVAIDVQRRAVTGTHIVLRNEATGVEHSLESDAGGAFRFEELPPGVYSMDASAVGFSAWRALRVVVEVGRLTELTVQLTVGGPHDSVTVTADDAPGLDRTSAAIATNVNAISLDSLPSNGRRWSNFALQTEGVTPDQNGYGLLSFRGISVLLNNNTVDGADNNQAFFSEERGRTRIGYSTSQASVREFQVNTSNYSAEYGRAAGGVVNTVTRSGGSRIHGEAFAYDRDNILGATNPFTTLTQLQPDGTFTTSPYRPTDVRKQWGAGIGGPLVPGKLFWFVAYDQYLRVFPGIARAADPERLFAAPSARTLNTLAARMGTTSDIAAVNYQSILNGLDSMLGSVSRTGHQLIFFPKLDWQANERNHLAVQYNFMRWNSPNGVQTGASDTYGIASFGNDFVAEDWAIGRWELFLTANMLNEARYQYGRDFESEFSQPPSRFEEQFANNAYGRSPQVSLASGSNGFIFGKPAFLDRAAYPDERRQEMVDTVTWVRGNHVWKTGYDINYVRDYSNNLYNGTGTYDYTNVLNFASDYFAPGHCNAAGTGEGTLPCYSHFTQAVGTTIFQFSTMDYSGFFADEWKVRHGLTLSLGVRYEYESLPDNVPLLINPDIPQTAKMPHDGNNFGPRLGFAWDVSGQGRTVVRGGYGMYFGRIINSTVFAALTGTGTPAAQRSYYVRPVDPGAPSFPSVLGAQLSSAIEPSATYFQKGFQNPQVHEFELSLAQQLGRGTDVTASYLMSLGRELPNFVDTNIDLTAGQTITYTIEDPAAKGPLKGSLTSDFFTTRLNPNYEFITDVFSETNSKYEAGMVKLNHRIGAVLDLHASYTYSHSSDYNQNESTFADNDDILDPTNFKLEYGDSDFDVRHRVTGSAILRTPWKGRGIKGRLLGGFAVAPVAEFRTGLPYTMHTSGAVPSEKYTDASGVVQTVSGIGASINGSGGDNRIGAVGRNTFRYPPVRNMDARLSKRTAITERLNLDVIAEVFNVLNHQNVTGTSTVGYIIGGATAAGGTSTLTYDPGFGEVTNSNSNTLYRERQIQLALRLVF